MAISSTLRDVMAISTWKNSISCAILQPQSSLCRDSPIAFRDKRIDVVVGPTTGGIILAFETARQLGVKAAYAERASDGSTGREIRRGTTFAPGSRVLVVDDILTTGGSVRETLDALKAHPVDVVAVGVMVDRSGGKTSFEDVPALRALRARIHLMGGRGMPAVRPGIADHQARHNKRRTGSVGRNSVESRRNRIS